MKRENVITCSGLFNSAVSGEAGEWIQLFRPGVNQPVIGAPYIVDDMDAIIKASLRPGVDIAIDREHGMDLRHGEDVPAAGWIKEMEAREDGIWARVEWTKRASQQLADKEYRYISPTFMRVQGTRRVARIIGAAITNRPQLELKALASVDFNSTKETEMEVLEQIAALLGLESGASQDAVIEAIDRLNAVKEGVQAAVDIPQETLDAAPEEVKAAVEDAVKKEVDGKVETEMASWRAKQGSQSKVDPAKYVPVEQVTALTKRVAELESKNQQEVAMASVTAAIESGKLPPALREWAVELASQNVGSFDEFVKNAGFEIVTASTAGKRINAPRASVDAEEEKIIKKMGISKEEYLKQLNG